MATSQDFQVAVDDLTPLLTGGWGMGPVEDQLKVILALLVDLWQQVEALQAPKAGEGAERE